ncbi:uncharacterized protein LOC132703064 [Cylas formicarius]|uniref:uncharacterized protein LOC132703064 n=1 Tax=Cylas formicarius TaxID=197179 RepID=UPI0029583F7D|nr:uncharacterized protein LOC132703064 [Cylas formicarius]XP_060528092.1 uncharacterized protein LOC132703064 [Cylas formicarius]
MNDRPDPITSPTTSSVAVAVAVPERGEVAQELPRIASKLSPFPKAASNPPLITVLNSTGPLTVLKNLCVSAATPPQYAAAIGVTNAVVGKSPTVTVLSCGPLSSAVAVVKTIDAPINSLVTGGAGTVVESRGHNVFVKNTTCVDTGGGCAGDSGQKSSVGPAPPQTNVIHNAAKPSTVNGQRNRLKVLCNAPSMTQSTALTSKMHIVNQQQKYPRHSVRSFAKPPAAANALVNSAKASPGPAPSPLSTKQQAQKAIASYPPKGQQQQQQRSIKTLQPQQQHMPPHQQQRVGLRTIPAQKHQKVGAPKPNYIGKHAIQGHKARPTYGRVKSPKAAPGNHHPHHHEKQLTFNQALTAQIIETLSNTSVPQPSNRCEALPARYDSAFTCPDKQYLGAAKEEDKSKSGLDTLSLICQAVLLDHNYNATLPCELPSRPAPPLNTQAHLNGVTNSTLYGATPGKKRTQSVGSAATAPLAVGVPGATALRNYEDDGGSDVSDVSEHKHDTEGEETDTAPEAEEVKNEDPSDHYGDYVTRCICGFLHDDGYMVECDRCKVWQHVQCVVKNRQVPDEYLCEICDPSKHVDRQKARVIQQQWMRDRQLLDPKLRLKPPKIKSDDTESSDEEHIKARNNNTPKGGKQPAIGRRKSEGGAARKDAKEAAAVPATAAPPPKRPKRKERKVAKRKSKSTPARQQAAAGVATAAQAHSEDENQEAWSAHHLPQLRQWIEKYEEAVTNHYSPELRARISSIRVNGVHQTDQSTAHYDASISKCRVHTQPLTEMRYLMSTARLAPNVPVIELRGKYMLSNQHRNSCGPLNTRQHTQRPGPFLFFYRLQKDNTEICVDTRTYGNDARFIRRSCRPNTELRHCIEKGALHLYVVSIADVEKDCELTIKHESHDLAAVGTTHIACACGRPDDCTVNRTTIRKNGDLPEKKRRTKRSTSSNLSPPESKRPLREAAVKAEPAEPPPQAAVFPKQEVAEPATIKPEPLDVRVKLERDEKPIKKEEVAGEEDEEEDDVKPEESPPSVKREKIKREEGSSPPPPARAATRRSSSSNKEEEAKTDSVVAAAAVSEQKTTKSNGKKLSREERKLEAILRAIEQMEKADQRKQGHQAKHAASHRRESEPGVPSDDKQEPKMKRRKRRGRARTTSTSAAHGGRRNRLNSTDSYMTSGDENLLSPSDGPAPPPKRYSKEDTEHTGLLLALSSMHDSKGKRTPPRELDNNSNSAQSSPETHLSSACLLVQAAVEPLEQGFKFPKTKKGLMNEWLNKAPEPVQAASSIYPPSLVPHISPTAIDDAEMKVFGSGTGIGTCYSDNSASHQQQQQQRGGNAKKRWLRQAISEDHSSEGFSYRPDSPLSNEMVAPPKKRKLPRESLSSENSLQSAPPKSPNVKNDMDVFGDLYCSKMGGEACSQTIDTAELASGGGGAGGGGLFERGDHLVGAVEKTLSIFGFRNEQAEPVTPPKRKVKLSITEYLQRKKLNSDKTDEPEPEPESSAEDNSVDVPKTGATTPQPRSRSSSFSSSMSSDEDTAQTITVSKASVFNSEPTELERQREISSIRLKKVFGLAVDDSNKTLDTSTIFGDIQSKLKSFATSLASPTFSEKSLSEAPPPPPPPPSEPPTVAAPAEPDEPVAGEDGVGDDVNDTTRGDADEPNVFYTPDDDDDHEGAGTTRFEPAPPPESSVSYVPPFNNPIYPNNNFNAYTSTIDDDSRYQSRNPSPPPPPPPPETDADVTPNAVATPATP